MNPINANLAASITKAASKQTYYIVRFLVDRDRVEDAYRTYAYFRWVDDTLDSAAGTNAASSAERLKFFKRQKSLLDCCFQGEPPQDVVPQEEMLVELVRHDEEKNSGLQAYLRNMMLVMEFDTRRRGKLVSQAELSEYTRWLAVAVTEALRHFVGHGEYAPRDETRYLAVTAAHITHMLRDTYDDVQAGYFNIPREVLEGGRFGPQELHCPAYRLWVKSRVQLARQYFEAGRSYFRRAQNLRHRLAGCSYMARFEWLLETIEREGFILRPQYDESKSIGTGLRMGWKALLSLFTMRGVEVPTQPVFPPQQGKA